MIIEYKKCTELLQLSPEMIRNWNSEIDGDTYLVKRQIFVRCPLTDELVSDKQCIECKHNFGRSSDKWIYCLPKTIKGKGWRWIKQK